MKAIHKAVPKFFMLVPLHAAEVVMGWFMVGTGLWIGLDVDVFRHPLQEMLELGNVSELAVGILLVFLGLAKVFFAFKDFCTPTEKWRKLRIAAGVLALITWALVLVNGMLWHGSVLLLRYTVLFITELWLIITGGRSRPGAWE